MPGVDGIEATRRILRERPGTRVIALTSFLDDDKVLPAVRAGAAGYLLKDVEPGELVRAIHTVNDGGAPAAPGRHGTAMRELAEDEPGRRVGRQSHGARARGARTGARGLPNKLIARELGIAEKTVKAHVSSILAKLGVTDRRRPPCSPCARGWSSPSGRSPWS